MSAAEPWVHDGNAGLLTDLYQITMLQAYWREGMEEEATFSLFARRLPKARNYLLACGLDDVLRYLEALRFTGDALDYLSTFGQFSADFLEWLEHFSFTGDVHAVLEGTPVFADESILEVTAPLPQAQLVETFVMNQIHLQTVLASKAARVVEAARGRAVVDFGLRRMHGTDAGMKAARAFHVAGVAATSNVLAGQVYGLHVTGTMAHSYVQAHDKEMEAFRAFASLYPDTTLLVDTYDTLEAVHKVVRLALEMGEAFTVRAIRLDSGDLAELAVGARRILDEAGLQRVEIFASGGLDEHEVDRIVRAGAPITGFGVGTGMGVSADAPSFDIAYKLTSYAGRGRLKLSPGKPILPGRKQVFRMEEGGRAVRDVIARADEKLPGRPLLVPVMRGGERVPAGHADLDRARARARDEISRLPAGTRALAPADPPYPVELSHALESYTREMAEAAMKGDR
ncbi:MAG: nicotinate phosphoribosyltransferase [Gemmatimonadota bacterium]